MREARVGAQLQHENLVRIYDFGESNGRFFLVMEYIEGKTIGALISAQGSIPPQAAAGLARQIALGLEHAHRKGLIHRDVNPYNVLVTHDGIAKVADLGLALDLAEEERVTREGATVGTFDYVAPEQARHSHAADIRSDIYSLGCTLYHMIAGQVPFPSPSLPEKLFAHQALEPTPLNEIVSHVPLELVEVVRRMMRKQPEERYPTPLQVVQVLEPFIEQQDRPRDVRTISGDVPPGEASQADIGKEAERSRMEPGEKPPSVPEPVQQLGGDVPGQPAQPKPGDTHIQPPITPIMSPLPDEGEANGTSAPLTASFHSHEGSSAESIPLFLDLGPEPSLSESLTRPKPRSGVQRSARNDSAPSSPSVSSIFRSSGTILHSLSSYARPRVITLVASILFLVCLITGFVLARRVAPHRASVSEAVERVKHKSNLDQKRSSSRWDHQEVTDHYNQGKVAGSPITVLDNDGTVQQADDLAQAMKIAIGSKGWVELHNRQPLKVGTIDRSPGMASNSWLKLRSATGVKAALIVEVKGQSPFLTIGSGVGLVVEGLES